MHTASELNYLQLAFEQFKEIHTFDLPWLVCNPKGHLKGTGIQVKFRIEVYKSKMIYFNFLSL